MESKRTYKKCLICNKEFWVYTYRIPAGEGKYCSRLCSDKSKIGKSGHWLGKKRPDLMKTNAGKTMFKKGLIPWNKGLEGFMKGEKNSRWNGGKPKCKLCDKEITYGFTLCFKHAMQKRSGKYSYQWKDEGYTQTALHEWVKKHLGYPEKCEICGTVENRKYHWANKSGEYKRNLSDWLRLCVPCHKVYDLARLGKLKNYATI